MAVFPLAVNVQGDYGYKVIVADDENTIGEVIDLSVEQIVSVLVAPFPQGTILHAKIHGSDEPLNNGLKIKEANLIKMEAIQIYVESSDD